MTQLTFDPSTHRKIKGKIYVRVTELLRARGLIDFSKIPEEDRQYYMDRGKGNHRLWEDVEKGIDHEFTYDERVEPYRAGHALFLKQTGFKAFRYGIEMAAHSDELKISGRLDRVGMMQNRYVLFDYKTTSVPSSTSIQTALYALCLKHLVTWYGVDRYGVAFTKDGKYRMSKKYPDSDKNEALWHVQEYHKENP